MHQHGLGSLSVAQQDNTLTVVFESPLDSLIGFETVPETAEQKELGNKLLAQLRDAAAVVTLPAEAKCTHTEPVITAPPRCRVHPQPPWATAMTTMMTPTAMITMAMTMMRTATTPTIMTTTVHTITTACMRPERSVHVHL